MENYKKRRRILSFEIEDAVCRLFIGANYRMPRNTESLIARAAERETAPLAKSILCSLGENLRVADEMKVPICQDTGMAVLFAEIGQDVEISGGFNQAVNRGVARAYREGYLRCSVVSDPLWGRINTGDNTPAVIYTNLCEGDKIKLTAVPKGFGSENMSALKMFAPSAGEDDVVRFVLDTVAAAGGNPCPPLFVGVGIGGTFDYCAVLAKRALLRLPHENRSAGRTENGHPAANNSPESGGRNPRCDAFEDRLLREINLLGIGPQGFGGDTTALGVGVEIYPTHIAGLPVAVNICCHVLRHAEITI